MGYNKVLHWNGAFWDNADAEKPTDKGYIVDIAFTQFGEQDVGWAVGGDLWYFKNSLPTVVEEPSKNPQVPTSFYMSQNYPNPFNPETQIEFEIPRESFVSIKIYNILGQKVYTLINENKTPGIYRITWDGRDEYGQLVKSGVYFYRLESDSFSQIKKMMYVR